MRNVSSAVSSRGADVYRHQTAPTLEGQAEQIADSIGAVSFGVYRLTVPDPSTGAKISKEVLAGAREIICPGGPLNDLEQISESSGQMQKNHVYVMVWDETAELWMPILNADLPETVKTDAVVSLARRRLMPNDRGSVIDTFVVRLGEVSQNRVEFDTFHSRGRLILDEFFKVDKKTDYHGLNANERNCLVWCACGKTSNEIADILGLSEHTVNHYFILASQKLAVNNPAQAVARAMKLGIISFDEVF